MRPAVAGDREGWAALFQDYRRAGHLGVDPRVADRVWAWTRDPTHPVRALVAADGDELVGFAHYRRFPRPITGDEGLYLDDLFTHPAARGRGVARALIEDLAQQVHHGDFAVLRWSTRPDNRGAQALYERIAQRAQTITYNLTPRGRQIAPG